MEWICVRDKQPERKGWYIVCYEYKGFDGYYCNSVTYSYFDGKNWKEQRGFGWVTYWMPFPNPPKEANKGNYQGP